MMAGRGAVPRADLGTADLGTMVVDDDDILKKNLIFKLNLNWGYINLRKTTDRVGCLNTLMNSLNEVISVHFYAKTNDELTKYSERVS